MPWIPVQRSFDCSWRVAPSLKAICVQDFTLSTQIRTDPVALPPERIPAGFAVVVIESAPQLRRFVASTCPTGFTLYELGAQLLVSHFYLHDDKGSFNVQGDIYPEGQARDASNRIPCTPVVVPVGTYVYVAMAHPNFSACHSARPFKISTEMLI